MTQVTTYLNNALYLAQMDAGTLLEWVTSGRLTSGNMDLIDAIQDKDDYKMLEVLLSENEVKDKASFYAKLGAVDTSHVSQMMMDKTYSRIFANADTYINGHDSEGNTVQIPVNLQAFFDTLSEQEQRKAKIYLEKLSIAGAREAATLSSAAIKMMPKFEGDLGEYSARWDALQNGGELAKINTTLAKMGNLSSLFDAAAVVGIGHSYKRLHDRPAYMVSRMFNLKKTDAGYKWDRVTYERKGSTEDSYVEYSRQEVSDKYTTSGPEVAGDKAYKAYQEIQQKKEEAVKDLFKTAFVGGTSLVSPELAGAISLASDMSGVDSISSILSVGGDAADQVLGDKYNYVAQKGVSGTKEAISFVESLYSISKEEQENSKDFQNTLFDAGGSTTAPTNSDPHTKIDMTYDLQAILQSHDMEENGLRSFVYREYGGEELEVFDKGILKTPTYDDTSTLWDKIQSYIEPDKGDSTQESLMSSDTRDFLAGKSNKTISEVGEANIWKGLENISNESTTFGMSVEKNTESEAESTWLGQYLKKNQHAFNVLVGNG